MSYRPLTAVVSVAFLGFVFYYAPEETGLLADRGKIPPHSVLSRTLSCGFYPVHVMIEAAPLANIVSREVRHNVFSIVYGREG
jgi:hypothetical protein